jgi:hypothetical protein
MPILPIISRVAQRFLSDRSFELIVAPALADVAYDEHPATLTTYAAVFSALAGAIWEDVVRGGAIGTFARLVMIPLCNYAFLFALVRPQGVQAMSAGQILWLAGTCVVLSLGMVGVCYWPPREPRNLRVE